MNQPKHATKLGPLISLAPAGALLHSVRGKYFNNVLIRVQQNCSHHNLFISISHLLWCCFWIRFCSWLICCSKHWRWKDILSQPFSGTKTVSCNTFQQLIKTERRHKLNHALQTSLPLTLIYKIYLFCQMNMKQKQYWTTESCNPINCWCWHNPLLLILRSNDYPVVRMKSQLCHQLRPTFDLERKVTIIDPFDM